MEPLLNPNRFFDVGVPTSVSRRCRHKLTLCLGNNEVAVNVRLLAPSHETDELVPKATLLGLTLREGSQR